jgi:hypothetical protein
MRPTYGVPQDGGSRRSHRCPPSHHEMALTPNYAQASARAPRLSQSSTGSPMLLAPVSPYHQQGSTKPSATPAASPSRHLVSFASMGGGKSPHVAARSLVWVDGTLTCYHRGGKAIAKLSPSFLADLVFSHPPSTNDGGERRLGGRPCFASHSPAFGICHVYTPRIC